MTRTGKVTIARRRPRCSAGGADSAALDCGGVSTRRRRTSARESGHDGQLQLLPDVQPDRPWAARWRRRWRTAERRCMASGPTAGRPRPARATSTRRSSTICLDAIGATTDCTASAALLTLSKCASGERLLRRRRCPSRRRGGLSGSADVDRRAERAAASRRRSGTTSRSRPSGRCVSSAADEAEDRRPPSRCGGRARARRCRRAGARPARPSTTKPSGRSSTATPARPSSRASAAMRSDSLMRSSARSANVVSPSAQRGGDGQRRDLVDGAQRELAVDARAAQVAGARAHAAHRLAHRVARRLDGQVGAHGAEHVERARARRVEADVLDDDVAARDDQRRDDEERRRRQIARDGERRGAQPPVPAGRIDDDRAARRRR